MKRIPAAILPLEPETMGLINGLTLEAATRATLDTEHPTAVANISRFGFERAYEIDEELERGDASRAVARALGSLTPREERVLRLRFGIGCTEHQLDAVGNDLGVTRERVRQIEAKALRKLKHPRIASILSVFKTGIAAPLVNRPAYRPRLQPQPQRYGIDISGEMVAVTVKRWIATHEAHEKATGHSGPFALFDHDGQEWIAAEHELVAIEGARE